MNNYIISCKNVSKSFKQGNANIEVLKNVGISALTNNSPIKEQIEVDYITKKKGGDGAFREFSDLILNNQK